MAPLAVKFVPSPLQIAELVGVIFKVNDGETLTVATAVAVHVPVPVKTEYVVVVVGAITTVPVAEGLGPLVADQR